MEYKINKFEPFNLEKLVSQVNTGAITGFACKPDFRNHPELGPAHVDLKVTYPNGDHSSYRIVDTTGASHLLDQFGASGFVGGFGRPLPPGLGGW